MALIDASDLTLNPREVESVGEVIFERVFNESDLSEFHDVETGIDVTTQIVLAGRIGLLGKKTTGCTPNEATGFELREKFWTPVMEDFRLTHCSTDMPALLKIFKKAKSVNPDFFDRVGSEEFGVIIAAVESAMLENIHRKVWFNDTAAAASTGGGVFTPTTDLGYFNSFDGLFKQIMIDVTAGATPKVAIAANAGANYAAQNLPDDAALGILEGMVEAADERLMADESAFFMVTRGIAENYKASLRNKNLGAGFMEVVENGRPKLFFDGIEVKVRYDWGRYIKAYQNNGTKWNLPNRAILTVKENIPVGTLDEGDLNKLDVFYDRTLKTNFMDAAWTIDAKHLEGYLTVAAY
jgi:hypothetical protein